MTLTYLQWPDCAEFYKTRAQAKSITAQCFLHFCYIIFIFPDRDTTVSQNYASFVWLSLLYRPASILVIVFALVVVDAYYRMYHIFCKFLLSYLQFCKLYSLVIMISAFHSQRILHWTHQIFKFSYADEHPKSYHLNRTKFWVAGSLLFLMGTAAPQYPYGITAHFDGNFGYKLDTSSSKFPSKVGFSRLNLYQSSASITNSKVSRNFLLSFLSMNH